MAFWRKTARVVTAPIVVPAKLAAKGAETVADAVDTGVDNVAQKLAMSMVRRLIIAGCGGLVAQGVATNDEVQALAGAVACLVAIAWSMYTRYRDHKAVAVAAK